MNNEQKLVSIVIPTYNSKDYIGECLKAVIEQTYNNIEIIIVDDGSTDDTKNICATYASRDKRIKIITQQNHGVSTARNAGIDAAIGDYITFVDADDIPELTLIEEYMDAKNEWKNKDISFISCGMFFDNYVNKNVDNKAYFLEPVYGYIEGENYLLARRMASTLAWLKLFNFVTNKFYSLRAIKEKNIRFDQAIHIGEDLNFNLDYLDAVTGNIGFINKPLYHYIKRTNNSLSISYHPNDLEDTKTIYARFIEWEKSQSKISEENILVLEAIFITDWTSRLSSMYDGLRNNDSFSKESKAILEEEIRSKEFKRMLSEIYRAKKISKIRYLALRTGHFGVFYLLRSIYQILKG